MDDIKTGGHLNFLVCRVIHAGMLGVRRKLNALVRESENVSLNLVVELFRYIRRTCSY